jgi:hypothetical protein
MRNNLMRYLAYSAGIVLKAAGVLLVLTAAIIWVSGRPNSRILLDTGAVCFAGGFLLKRASRLKKCFRCREKIERDAARCRHCGSDLPANAAESLSEPFYK